jgi:hypothetical protein
MILALLLQMLLLLLELLTHELKQVNLDQYFAMP